MKILLCRWEKCRWLACLLQNWWAGSWSLLYCACRRCWAGPMAADFRQGRWVQEVLRSFLFGFGMVLPTEVSQEPRVWHSEHTSQCWQVERICNQRPFGECAMSLDQFWDLLKSHPPKCESTGLQMTFEMRPTWLYLRKKWTYIFKRRMRFKMARLASSTAWKWNSCLGYVPS